MHGFANLIDKNTIEIDSKNAKHKLSSDFIILLNGTVQRNLYNIEIDQKFLISSKETMVLEKIPKDHYCRSISIGIERIIL